MTDKLKCLFCNEWKEDCNCTDDPKYPGKYYLVCDECNLSVDECGYSACGKYLEDI